MKPAGWLFPGNPLSPGLFANGSALKKAAMGFRTLPGTKNQPMRLQWDNENIMGLSWKQRSIKICYVFRCSLVFWLCLCVLSMSWEKAARRLLDPASNTRRQTVFMFGHVLYACIYTEIYYVYIYNVYIYYVYIYITHICILCVYIMHIYNSIYIYYVYIYIIIYIL